MHFFASSAIGSIADSYLASYGSIDPSVQWQLNETYHSSLVYEQYVMNPDAAVRG